MSEITAFAQTNFRNQSTAFGIKTDDRRRHLYAIGKTGMGKTNMLENLAIQDIRNGRGLCFIDPHGDTAEKLISMIPPERINDVIYFNPSDQDFPISFNVLEEVPREFRPLVASGLIGVFQKLWADSWGPRLEYILRNALLALLETPGSTLLGVMRILVDKKYRIRVSNNITDPVVKSFWTEEFPKWNERVLQEVISPIQNKVGQFLTSPIIRNVVGQTKSAFNVRTVMDEKKILILNLAKGRMGEDNSALIGAMMITKIQLAAMGRVDMDENEREDFYLYVDEFQNFSTESFANILSEARKYRLNLILANQYITQIDEIVRDAIFGNVGTIVSFRVGAVDAEYLEKEFEPIFTMNDIVNLPKYNIYLKLMIDGIAGDAFSAITLPPIERKYDDSTEKVIAVSRERYAQDREVVEEKIARWSGMLVETSQSSDKKNVTQPTVNISTNQKKGEKKEIKNDDEQAVQKEVYNAVCASCDLEIQVPFKPDGNRPVFCKECFKDHQRVVAKSKKNDEQRIAEAKKPKKSTIQKEESNVTESEDVITTDETAMSLTQLKHVAPKKFKHSSKKSKIDTVGVREMINKSRKNSE
ncbi:MAG: CxxC-x17-CxxC domain-containing protein [Patescibacteria group bacterium]|nr:CxxC-x17-CxxC domain-containing protein [Patescibacteria group bacterium]